MRGVESLTIETDKEISNHYCSCLKNLIVFAGDKHDNISIAGQNLRLATLPVIIDMHHNLQTIVRKKHDSN